MHSVPSKRFWRFQLGFWIVIGLALFLSGLTHLPVIVSLVRNAYFPIIGFISSFAIIGFLPRLQGKTVPQFWISYVVLCTVLALISVVIVNPISFAQIDGELSSMPLSRLFAGAFNLILVYNLWGALYLLLTPEIMDNLTDRRSHISERLLLEKDGQLYPIAAKDISYIKAAGDYVEVFVGATVYLHRATLTAFLEKLPVDSFVKIHRSTVVNLAFVVALKPLTKGEFAVEMKAADRLKVSRSYAKALRAAFEHYSVSSGVQLGS